MQFLPSLVVYKDVWGTSTVLALNVDWQPGWLLGWHALEGGSPWVGGVVRLEIEIKPGDSGRLLSVACGARTLWFLGISFCHCRFSCDLNWCMASLALMCGLAKAMVTSNWGETVLWPPQEHLDWPGIETPTPEKSQIKGSCHSKETYWYRSTFLLLV